MESIELRNVENDGMYKFSGRLLAEKQVHFPRPAHQGDAHLYAVANPDGVWANPNYILALEIEEGAYQITESHDFHRLQKFCEMAISDETKDPVDRHPLRGHAMELMRQGAANDLELQEVYVRLGKCLGKWIQDRPTRKAKANIDE